jgi:hypothetical protein
MQTKTPLRPTGWPARPAAKPGAPPVYRPMAAKLVQPKAWAPQRALTTAPPVYRPGQPTILRAQAQAGAVPVVPAPVVPAQGGAAPGGAAPAVVVVPPPVVVHNRAGTARIRPSNGAWSIHVVGPPNPWFDLPVGHAALAEDQPVTFTTQGDSRQAQNLVLGAAPPTYVVEGRTLTARKVRESALTTVPGRLATDVVVLTVTDHAMTIHVHPHGGGQNRPSGGGVRVDAHISLNNAPQGVVDAIAARPDFWTVAAH